MMIIGLFVSPGAGLVFAADATVRRRVTPSTSSKQAAKKRQEAALRYTAHFRIACRAYRS